MVKTLFIANIDGIVNEDPLGLEKIDSPRPPPVEEVEEKFPAPCFLDHMFKREKPISKPLEGNL